MTETHGRKAGMIETIVVATILIGALASGIAVYSVDTKPPAAVPLKK